MPYLSREPTEEGIPKVAKSEGKVFVEEVSQETTHSVV